MRRELNGTEKIVLLLSGVVQDGSRMYCKNLERQVTDVLYESREHSLISEEYHFVTSGAFPWSEEISNAFSIIKQSSRYLGLITGGGSKLIDPDFIEPNFKIWAELLFEERDISTEDYQFLQGLGKKIEASTDF